MTSECDGTEIQADAINWFNLGRNHNDQTREMAENLAPSPYADFYKMDHAKRGLAVVFNHVNFALPECSKRPGSNKDRDDLEKLFHELDFDVLIHNDLSYREILSTLIAVSQMDHTNKDCLIIVVMSHGDNGKLYARDREYPTNTLWRYFHARNCPTLAGKPKLFFIQACRGSNLHPGVEVKYPVEEDGDDNNDAYYSIPAMADILVMYSTVEGFFSWRDPQNGGYFVQSLVKQLKQHYKTKDLLTILTFVNREVAIDFTSYDPGDLQLCGQKQMCSVVSMLTRLLYFTPKKQK